MLKEEQNLILEVNLMIKVTTKGNWKKTNSFLERCLNLVKLGKLDKYGQEGVEALREATPRDSGETANSWYYRIVRNRHGVSIEWLNSSQNEGIPIVILLQYGHGFQNGAYYEGLDFINPALKPVFENIAETAWRELTDE